VSAILEQSDALSAIRLEGTISIGCAAELKSILLQALGSGTRVRVSLEGASDLDVTSFQLLWAAEKMAGESGVEYLLVGHVPEQVSQDLVNGGFGSLPMTVDAMRDDEVCK
jgi:anti-anti-sigma regulatory factor